MTSARTGQRGRERALIDPHAVKDPEIAARAARLHHVTDDGPGIRRKRVGKHFSYIGLDGKPIRDECELKRIRSLAIPPAYTDVWICPDPNGHIQATARDARGRKQYRYHPRWREVRDENKFYRMIEFGQTLPSIRSRIAQDLARPGMPREKVLAAIVRLLETTLIRVGNEEYARKNRSFGLTTLRNRHIEIEGSKLHFRFRGKSGKIHHIDLKDARLARILRRCRELPGQELFQYIDDQGDRHNISSADVNGYLREITNEDYTAKDFRTWAGTVLAAIALQEFEKFETDTQARKNIVQAIERVSAQLGNTPAVCRKCYVHPAVMEAYLEGATIGALRQRAERAMEEEIDGLEPEEAAVLALLQQRLAHPELRAPGLRTDGGAGTANGRLQTIV